MPGDRSPLYVRIPTAEARKLDRAAFELGTPKQDLVAGLVARYVDPGDLGALEELAGRRRVTVETADDTLTVGRHSFQPAGPSEVLTLDELAALLQVEPAEVERMAEAGELPGRRIGEEWRFSRRAVLDWLASANDEGA
jgi:excisionase family DNA binding protein